MMLLPHARPRGRLGLGALIALSALSFSCRDRVKPPAEQLTAVDTKPPPLPTVPPLPGAPPVKAPAPRAEKPKASDKPVKERERGPRSALGTNLEGIADWSPNWAFVDAQKRARDFISAPAEGWSDERAIELDENGWPTKLLPSQRIRSLVFWGDDQSWPGGKYLILYDGQGTLEYDPQGKLLENKPGRQLLSLDPKKGTFGYVITKTGKGPNYLRNVRVLMPGGVCEGEQTAWCDEKNKCAGGKRCEPFEKVYERQIFHPIFLANIAPFGALRFMDWMATNESKERAWKDRPKPGDANYRRGVPVEVMVELANRMSQDAWFTMPHAADDDWIRQFAIYVRDHLRPELKVYVEYSNEVWNGQFPQADYAVQQGQKLKLGEGWDAQWRFYAQRTLQVQKIWEGVFAGKRERLVRVVAAQAANLGVADSILGFPELAKHVDALAIAPYFGFEYGVPEVLSRWENASVDELIADIRKSSLPTSIEWMRAHAALAAKHKIDLVAYEGGQHLVGVGPAQESEKLNQLFDRANRDPRMKAIYADYFEAWRKEGGKLFVHFTNVGSQSKYGRWGALETLTQKRGDAPKHDACLTFIEKTPRWW